MTNLTKEYKILTIATNQTGSKEMRRIFKIESISYGNATHEIAEFIKRAHGHNTYTGFMFYDLNKIDTLNL